MKYSKPIFVLALVVNTLMTAAQNPPSTLTFTFANNLKIIDPTIDNLEYLILHSHSDLIELLKSKGYKHDWTEANCDMYAIGQAFEGGEQTISICANGSISMMWRDSQNKSTIMIDLMDELAKYYKGAIKAGDVFGFDDIGTKFLVTLSRESGFEMVSIRIVPEK